MKITRKQKEVVLLSLLVLVFLVLLSFLAFSIILVSLNDESVGESQGNHKYQLLSVNHQKNETSRGIVSLPNLVLGADEFVEYGSEGVQTHIISNIGSQEYMCRGTCSCGEDRSRRVLKTDILFFFACIGTAITLKLAWKSWRRKCKEENPDEELCEDPQPEVDTETCEPINSIDNNNAESEKNYDHEEINLYGGERKGTMVLCTGNCDYNKNLKNPEDIEEAKSFGCEEMNIESLMTLKNDEESATLEQAKERFYKDSLRNYCDDLTILRILESPGLSEEERIFPIPMCLAREDFGNIECVFV